MMTRSDGSAFRWAIVFLLGLKSCGTVMADEPSTLAIETTRVDFNRQVRAILSDKCFHCHGPDPQNRKAGLRLDTKEGAFAETKTGLRAVVPTDTEESELIARITSEDDGDRMPPASLGRDLTEQEIDVLTRWIEQGAEWQEHWAFSPIERPAPPDVDDSSWPRTPIDRFVLARLKAEGLSPAPEASRERLLRRLCFDLTGLPPTLEQLDEFLQDDRPDDYERLVDRLLASPRFGERMAVDWLDAARYADTFGYQADVYRAMWPWRDWVVRAFNSDLPYDQFISWQIAGDLEPNPTRDMILATAFNRHHRQTNEGGSIEEEWRVEYVADRTITYGSTFLGLTLECARCHTHKYDPITQKDFYSLFSFFNNIDESGLYSHFTNAVPTPTLLLSDSDLDQALGEAEKRVESAEAQVASVAIGRRHEFDAWLNGLDRSKARTHSIEGRIGDFPLDAIEQGTTLNRVDPAQPGKTSDDPVVVEGRFEKAFKFDGENNVSFPLGDFDRFQPFTLSLWIRTPDVKDRAVILRRSPAWTDAGSRGYQLLIEEGRLTAALVHFWPGNAIGIAARDPLPVDRWVHVALSYNGASRAAGLVLYVDGRPAPIDVVRDGLTKTITGGGENNLTLAQRFRDRGFQGGSIDELLVFDRALTPIEIVQLFDGRSLDGMMTADPSMLSKVERDQAYAYYLANVDSEYREALSKLLDARKEQSRLADPVAEIMAMKELDEPRPAFVLNRGEYDAPGEPVAADTPSSLPPFPGDQPRNRLGLARWTIAPQNPLTARVAVNRWWQSFYGRGLVSTPEDFGSQGELPSHPELLDWLASELVDSGWGMKSILRLIVCSSTYRQSSESSPELQAFDPENVLLARGPRERLSAEMLRDNALAVSGLLVGDIGGPPVKPFQPNGLWEEKSNLPYVRDEGPGSHRRSLYTYWKRTSPPPAMLTFDAANREVCAVRRHPTATPLQALVLLNDPQFVEAARGLAERAMRLEGSTTRDRVGFVFLTLTGRRADSQELDLLESLHREQYEEFASGAASAAALLAVGDAPGDATLDPIETAAMTIVAQALFSYDESVVKH